MTDTFALNFLPVEYFEDLIFLRLSILQKVGEVCLWGGGDFFLASFELLPT